MSVALGVVAGMVVDAVAVVGGIVDGAVAVGLDDASDDGDDGDVTTDVTELETGADAAVTVGAAEDGDVSSSDEQAASITIVVSATNWTAALGRVTRWVAAVR